MAGLPNRNIFTFVLFKVIDSITDANSGCLECGLGWFRCNAFKFVLQLLILSQKTNSGCCECGLGWFRGGLVCFRGPKKKQGRIHGVHLNCSGSTGSLI